MKKFILMIFAVSTFLLLAIAASYYFQEDGTIIMGILIIGALIGLYLFNKEELLISLTLVSSLLVTYLSQQVSAISLLTLIPDVGCLLLLLRIMSGIGLKRIVIKLNEIKYIFILLSINILSFVINRYSVYVFMWGIRGNFRFIILYLAVIYLKLPERYIRNIIKFCIGLAALQVLVTAYQYRTEYRLTGNWDVMSGTFGAYGTGVMMQYLIIITAILLALFKYKKISVITLLVSMLLIFIPMVLGEVKAAFFYIPILFIFAVFENFNRNTLKKILTVFVGITILFSSFKFISYIYGDVDSGIDVNKIFTSEFYYNYLYSQSYGNSDLNRISSIEYINKYALDNQSKKLVGIGAGNGTYSKFEVFQGEYYKMNSSLNYNFFFVPYYLLENGWLGLAFYLIFIFSIVRRCYKYENIEKNIENKIILNACKFSMPVIVLTFIYTNGNTLDQFGYFMWFICGLSVRLVRKIEIGESNGDIC